MTTFADENGTPDPSRRTAILIVAGEECAPDRTFEEIRSRFGEFFDQIVILSIGLVDYEVVDAKDFNGAEVGNRVTATARGAVSKCVEEARRAGLATVTCVAIGTDPVEEIEKLSVDFARRCPKAMFFLGKVVFENRKWYHGLLHSRSAEAIQKRLERRGLPVTILPIVLPG